jgi:dolichol-phosphate mannosyltransferase
MKNEAESIPSLMEAVRDFKGYLDKKNLNLQLLIHDNDSNDDTWELISNWAKFFRYIDAYRFGRDLGYQQSLSIAFNHSRGDAFIILQSDLQDPPLLMEEMVNRWLDGEICVVGVASKRGESLVDKLGRTLFVALFKSSGDFENFRWFTDFYLLDKKAYTVLRNLPLANQFIRGRIISDIGIDSFLEYSRVRRARGQSKFTFVKKYNFALDAILLNNAKFIRWITMSSGFTLLFGVLSGILTLWNSGLENKATLILLSLISFGSLQISLLSFILEYVARIYKKHLNSDLSAIGFETLISKQIVSKVH